MGVGGGGKRSRNSYDEIAGLIYGPDSKSVAYIANEGLRRILQSVKEQRRKAGLPWEAGLFMVPSSILGLGLRI